MDKGRPDIAGMPERSAAGSWLLLFYHNFTDGGFGIWKRNRNILTWKFAE